MPITERGARLSEGIDVLRKLWRGASVSHAGRFFGLTKLPCSPSAPVRRAADLVRRPIRRRVRRVGCLTDGSMSYVVTPEMYAQGLVKIAATAAKAGRRFERGFGTGHLLFARIDETFEKALDVASVTLSRRYAMDFRKPAERYCASARRRESPKPFGASMPRCPSRHSRSARPL